MNALRDSCTIVSCSWEHSTWQRQYKTTHLWKLNRYFSVRKAPLTRSFPEPYLLLSIFFLHLALGNFNEVSRRVLLVQYYIFLLSTCKLNSLKIKRMLLDTGVSDDHFFHFVALFMWFYWNIKSIDFVLITFSYFFQPHVFWAYSVLYTVITYKNLNWGNLN